jgi:hypothetical protein
MRILLMPPTLAFMSIISYRRLTFGRQPQGKKADGRLKKESSLSVDYNKTAEKE